MADVGIKLGNGVVITLTAHGEWRGPTLERGIAEKLTARLPTEYRAGQSIQWREAHYVADFLLGTITTEEPPPDSYALPKGAVN
jgi:hypothetical protein